MPYAANTDQLATPAVAEDYALGMDFASGGDQASIAAVQTAEGSTELSTVFHLDWPFCNTPSASTSPATSIGIMGPRLVIYSSPSQPTRGITRIECSGHFATTSTNFHMYVGGGITLYSPSNSSISVCTDLYSTPINLIKESKALLRKKRRKVRGSIKRAVSLLGILGMEEETRIFIGNDTFEVSHPSSPFKFKFNRDNKSVLNHTTYPGYSTPYALELWTKEEEYLAKLCVYLKDTPILDQVAAIAVFIKSGEEQLLLEKANFFQCSKDLELLEDVSDESPILKQKFLPYLNRMNNEH